MGIISEFREFAVKGNMIDMAVGIIMGAAFGTVITSLVNDIIMPPIGAMLGGVDFSSLSLALPSLDPAKPATLNYGKFINAVISFLIIAWAVFMLVKGVNRAKAMVEKPKAPPAPPAPPRSEVLLEEIRNALVKAR